jgi:transposase-like protein
MGKKQKNKKGGPRFSQEAKAEAIRLVRERIGTQEQVATSMGISSRTLRNWIKEDNVTPLTPDERRYLKKLERENQRIKLELEILKKARTFSVKHRS